MPSGWALKLEFSNHRARRTASHRSAIPGFPKAPGACHSPTF